MWRLSPRCTYPTTIRRSVWSSACGHFRGVAERESSDSRLARVAGGVATMVDCRRCLCRLLCRTVRRVTSELKPGNRQLSFEVWWIVSRRCAYRRCGICLRTGIAWGSQSTGTQVKTSQTVRNGYFGTCNVGSNSCCRAGFRAITQYAMSVDACRLAGTNTCCYRQVSGLS